MTIEDCVVVSSYVRVNVVCFSYNINRFPAPTPLTAVSVINVFRPSHKVSFSFWGRGGEGHDLEKKKLKYGDKSL